MKSVLSIFLFLLWTPWSSFSQKHEEKVTVEKINSYLSKLESAGFYGAVLAELNGEPVLSQGYGFSDEAKGIKNSAKTIFDVGSITKQFTAAAILKLEMQGKLSTEDRISHYFEDVPPDKEGISIHDLLRHQSGLVSTIGRDYEKITEEDFLDRVLSSELKFDVGSSFQYSNIGYSLLNLIIEAVSGQTYETYVYENLWKPVGMEMTGYSRPDFNEDLIAEGYSGDASPWGKPTDKEWDGPSPYLHLKGNGGILSTTEDLYKWHKALSTEQVLSDAAKEKLFSPELRTGETRDSYYAYGWDVSQTSRGTPRHWHNGSNRIFYADFLRFPEEEVAVLMLSNKSHPSFNDLSFEISKLIFHPSFEPEIPAEDNETNRNFTTHIIETLGTEGLEKAREEYKNRKSSEQLLDFLMREEGFGKLNAQQPEIAILIFEMNVSAHPGSAKALQALGEAYMETGKNELAIKYFRESLSRDPENPFVRQMIKRLEE